MKNKYDEPTKIVNLKGVGKVYKIPFSSAGLDLSPPDYYLYTNFDPHGKVKKVFPIEKYDFNVGKCDVCRHQIVKVENDFKHINFTNIKGDKFCITDKCHCLDADSCNSYSSWGRRCSCIKAKPEKGIQNLNKPGGRVE